MTRFREKLFPKIKPFYSGYFRAGDGHTIYYERCGNKYGIPVVYLHGGPGSGSDETARRFFDPRLCNILVFDQRGSGRSKPYASIEANTTEHLIEDMRGLLKSCFGNEKVLLFGGSWGSTLALLFAIEHPEMVSGMVLRGIFFGARDELSDYVQGVEPPTHFPEIWERFISYIPEHTRSAPAQYYLSRMMSAYAAERDGHAFEWAHYEDARCRRVPKSELELMEGIKSEPYLSRAILEAYYYLHHCFIEEGFILNNIHRMPRVPTSIIHGRHDDICRVKNALLLDRALPHAKLHIVDAGHARSDPEILKKLISETNLMVSELLKQSKNRSS